MSVRVRVRITDGGRSVVVKVLVNGGAESDEPLVVVDSSIASKLGICGEELDVIRAMNLNNVKKVCKPALHGVGWPGDVRRIALRIDKLKALGFKPSMNSKEAVRVTAKKLVEELNECI